MKVATFKINDINKRLENLLAWLAETEPDVVCLQELKAEHAPVRIPDFLRSCRIGRFAYVIYSGEAQTDIPKEKRDEIRLADL